MIRLAANLSMMFAQAPFLDRFAAAARHGFRGVEYLFPYDAAATEIRARLEEHRLTQVLFNLPAGDWTSGERGIAGLPGRTDEFRRGVDSALHYARRTGCRKLHAMPGKVPAGVDRERCLSIFVDNLIFPGRHEPGTGEIRYEWLLDRIDELGYTGWIGCEYKPRGATAAGLSWAARYLSHSGSKGNT